MFRRPNGVRVVRVGPDGSLLNYHGPSEQEAAVGLFDSSERPLSALAERLLKSLANDMCRTQRTSSLRSTSGWWNGQPVQEEASNNAFDSPKNTSTPQKQSHQTGDLPLPSRPSKVTTPVIIEENSASTKNQLITAELFNMKSVWNSARILRAAVVIYNSTKFNCQRYQ